MFRKTDPAMLACLVIGETLPIFVLLCIRPDLISEYIAVMCVFTVLYIGRSLRRRAVPVRDVYGFTGPFVQPDRERCAVPQIEDAIFMSMIAEGMLVRPRMPEPEEHGQW